MHGYPYNHLGNEYIRIFNHSQQKYKLGGWRLEYQDLLNGNILHTHNFLQLSRGSFDPGEYILLISGNSINKFDQSFRRWRIYTDIDRAIFLTPYCRAVLFDERNTILDSFSTIDYRNIEELDGIFPDRIKQHKPIIFISHGHRPEWRHLRDHLHDKHGFECLYFESEERAGLTVTEVIDRLGKEPHLALFVMTGENKMANGECQARQNVVHELGLFQRHLGLNRAIPLVEKGVAVPSNISGTQEIRFAKGRFKETYGDVLAVIRREFGL